METSGASWSHPEAVVGFLISDCKEKFCEKVQRSL